MATEKQTAANRVNAQKSTGPRTPEGKARSSQNALQSGVDAESEIIRGESPEKLQALIAQYTQQYCPATPAELFQVDIMIRCDWLAIRFGKAEAQLWESGMKAAIQCTEKDQVGRGFYHRDAVFARLGRRVDATRRAYTAALRELERLQSDRLASEAAQAAEQAAQAEEAAAEAIETEAPSGELGSNLTGAPQPAAARDSISPTPKFGPESASAPFGARSEAPPRRA